MIKYNTKNLKKAILNSKIDDTRYDLNPMWDGDTWDSFLELIVKDNEFLQTILNNADTNAGIEDIKPMEANIYLLDDIEIYNGLSSLIKMNIVILQDDNIFSREYNYLWKFKW